MKESDHYTILVNTCDAYSDCWEPFFKLFSIYWPDYYGKIFLNTEKKDFFYPGLNITATKVCYEDEKDLPWGERFRRCLEKIDQEIILYLTDDFFFKDKVKNDLVEKFVLLMKDNSQIHCIHLTDQAVISEDNDTHFPKLNLVKLHQRYRVSLQAALWEKKVLQSYVRTNESIWQFEELGSKRAAILQHNFYVVDKDWVKLNEFEIIPYIFTGITQGRWNEEVVELFERHNIKVEYEKRGFVKDIPKRSIRDKILFGYNRLPILIRHYFYINKLKKLRDDKNMY